MHSHQPLTCIHTLRRPTFVSVVLSVQVAEELLEMKNYNGVKEIVAGIDSPAVIVLKRRAVAAALERQSPSFELRLGVIRTLFSASKNHRAYRELLERTAPPCITFLGSLLSDLAMLGAPTFKHGGQGRGGSGGSGGSGGNGGGGGRSAGLGSIKESVSADSFGSVSSSSTTGSGTCADDGNGNQSSTAGKARNGSLGGKTLQVTKPDSSSSSSLSSASPAARSVSADPRSWGGSGGRGGGRGEAGGARGALGLNLGILDMAAKRESLDLTTHLKIARAIHFIQMCQLTPFPLTAVETIQTALKTNLKDASLRSDGDLCREARLVGGSSASASSSSSSSSSGSTSGSTSSSASVNANTRIGAAGRRSTVSACTNRELKAIRMMTPQVDPGMGMGSGSGGARGGAAGMLSGLSGGRAGSRGNGGDGGDGGSVNGSLVASMEGPGPVSWTQARMAHTFDAQGPKELSVVEGHIITIVEVHDDGWTSIIVEGVKGIVPTAFAIETAAT